MNIGPQLEMIMTSTSDANELSLKLEKKFDTVSAALASLLVASAESVGVPEREMQPVAAIATFTAAQP